jgi:hypothetical protein
MVMMRSMMMMVEVDAILLLIYCNTGVSHTPVTHACDAAAAIRARWQISNFKNDCRHHDEIDAMKDLQHPSITILTVRMKNAQPVSTLVAPA